jgi:uncharacterized protein
MRYWDTSAIVPLLVSEPWSSSAEELLRSDQAVVAWWASRIECASALRRRERRRTLDAAGVRRSLDLLDRLAAGWSEVTAGEAVRARAERALAVHPLSAADALQLAAALTWRGEVTERRALVCLDERLRDAASREGFAVLPAEMR